MGTEKVGGYISKLQFNTGEEITILKNDIVIFVGPNNAGKSQSLKDIYALSQEKVPSVVISSIDITKYSTDIPSLLNDISEGTNNGRYIGYNVLGKDLYVYENTKDRLLKDPYFGEYRSLFVANLDTSARLTICNPPPSIRRNGAKTHPIHYAAFDSKYRKWLSDNFKKAFNIEITPNTQYGSSIPLCIGEPVQLSGKYENEQERLEAYADILETYKQVQNQGDGIKSFTGILLYLMLDYYCTFLLDEPESFLHPPQARIMGQIIGQTLSIQQQAFISTHSEEIIKGLMEVCPERIKIIRITRDKDANSFSILDNKDFKTFWNDPLLKYSNIMASLFHKKVVLCESDSDCKMYSIVESHIKQKQGKYSETLFIHCGGKHRIAKIVSALKSLNVDVKVIADIDILNDETVFSGIVSSYGANYDLLKVDYNILVSNLNNLKDKVDRKNAKTNIDQLLDSSASKDLSNKEIKDIKEIVSTTSKWDGIKKAGSSAIPAGDPTKAFGRINQALKGIGIYIVLVGELEGFVREIGGHGPEWVNTVIETYTELDDDVYKPITQFIESMDL